MVPDCVDPSGIQERVQNGERVLYPGLPDQLGR